MTNLATYTKACQDIDAILASCDDAIGLEGLNSSLIGRMFVSVVDTLGQICKTSFSNLINITKSIKRSELNEFTQSNSLKMRTVDKIPYEKRVDIDVDTPANMKGTYKETVNALIQVYVKLGAYNTTKLCDVSFRETLSAMMAGNTDVSHQIEATATIIGRTMTAAKPAIDFAMGQFDGKFEYKRPYQDVFLDNSEWVSVRKELIDNESRLQDVRKLGEMVTSMENTLKEIAKLADDPHTTLTQKDLKNMAETAKGIALILDAYGMATTRQMAIEHNYVLCANHLYEICK